MREIDLCIIVGNALDNALEACLRLREEEPPFIRIRLGVVKKCLLLEVRNRMALEDGFDGGAGEDMGRKKRLGKHGLGLGNIRAAAAGYHGTVHTEAEDGVFAISVLLPLLCQAENG